MPSVAGWGRAPYGLSDDRYFSDAYVYPEQDPHARRDDLLAAVEASDDLATFGHLHPSAAVRDAAGELAELRQAGDEVLLYQSEAGASEVQHD